jgi:hypothetical protein
VTPSSPLILAKLVAKRLIGPKAMRRFKHHRAVQAYGARQLIPRNWPESVLIGTPIDDAGPIPWITYPALAMLRRIVNPAWRVFEYGCGNSSLWWSARVSFVASVEHDDLWADHISTMAQGNLHITARRMGDFLEPGLSGCVAGFFERNYELPSTGALATDLAQRLVCAGFEAYASELARYDIGSFDVVVVDGAARCLTAWVAGHFVKPDGIIIFDNADRWQYNVGYQILAELGFKRLDFYGPGPVNTYEWCTSIFCRDLEWAACNVTVAEDQQSDLGW